MEVVRFQDAGTFLAETRPFLVAREAEHNLILGLSAHLERDPRAFGDEPPYLARVDAAGETVCVALRTPPYPLVLSQAADPAAVDVLLEDVVEMLADPAEVNGPEQVSRRFAEAWSQRTSRPIARGMSQRIFAAESATLPGPLDGAMRRATRDDRALLASWLDRFLEEALPDGPQGGRPAPAVVEEYLARPGDEGAYLWADGEPVSFAVCGGPTPSGIRVGPVYTPPELRGRGYATGLVAELTRRLLDAGRRFCFLYTDLANPTSNRIYERIGYRAVADVQVYRLG